MFPVERHLTATCMRFTWVVAVPFPLILAGWEPSGSAYAASWILGCWSPNTSCRTPTPSTRWWRTSSTEWTGCGRPAAREWWSTTWPESSTSLLLKVSAGRTRWISAVVFMGSLAKLARVGRRWRPTLFVLLYLSLTLVTPADLISHFYRLGFLQWDPKESQPPVSNMRNVIADFLFCCDNLASPLPFCVASVENQTAMCNKAYLKVFALARLKSLLALTAD